MRDTTRREVLEVVQSYLVVLLVGVIAITYVAPQIKPFTALPHFFFAALMPVLAIVYLLIGTTPKGQGSSRISAQPSRDGASEPVGKEAEEANRPPISDTARASLAVLPMENLSDGDEDNNLVQGFSMEIIRALYGVPDIRVASYQQSMTYAGKD